MAGIGYSIETPPRLLRGDCTEKVGQDEKGPTRESIEVMVSMVYGTGGNVINTNLVWNRRRNEWLMGIIPNRSMISTGYEAWDIR